MDQIKHHPFSELKKEARFFFIRHGESEGNKKGLIQGKYNLPLTEKGREQAQRAGSFFKGQSVQALYASPLARAKETAQILARELSMPNLEFREDLEEVHTGSFTGKDYKSLAHEVPEIWRKYRAYGWVEVPEAESSQALHDRARRHWKELVEAANAGKTITLSVTHGAFFQQLFASAYLEAPAVLNPLVHMDNCGISQLFVEPIPESSGLYHASWRLLNYQA